MTSPWEAERFRQIENNTLAILQELKELRIDFVQHLDDRLKERAHAAREPVAPPPVQTATTYQDRVRAELHELAEKTDALENFMKSGKWSEVSPVDQGLLSAQLVIMTAYRTILQQRVDNFV